MALEITCLGSEAALALVGAARRLKVHAKARDVRGVDRVVIRDGEAIAALLTRLDLPAIQQAADTLLQGISGDTPFVLVRSALVLTCDDGGTAHLRGEFAAFTEPSST